MEVREKYIARLLKDPTAFGFTEIKFVHAPQVQYSRAIRLRCQYTCHGAGSSVLTPPHSPTMEEAQRMIDEFKFGVFVRREIPAPLPADFAEVWRDFEQSLVEAENESFIRGYGRAFAVASGNCLYCHHDESMRPCTFGGKRRPTLEAIGINLHDTFNMMAWEHHLVREPDAAFNLFGLLMLE
jgi:predicted metal-binding protein